MPSDNHCFRYTKKYKLNQKPHAIMEHKGYKD